MIEQLYQELGSIRVSETEIAMAECALRASSGRNAAVIRKGWSGHLGLRHKGLLFIGVQTLVKPPRQILAVCNANSDVRLPSERVGDLNCVAEQLGLELTSDVVGLFELCKLDYGAVSRKCRAIRIENTAEVRQLLGDSECAESDEYWWQKWGGYFYAARHTPVGIEVDLLRIGVGKYRRLPISMRR